EWSRFTSRLMSCKNKVTIGITGKYTAVRDSYASIIKAIEHSGVANDADVDIAWIDTAEISNPDEAREAMSKVDAIIVPGGFGVRGTTGKNACIEHARTTGMPLLGICMGFQMAVIEYARNVLGLQEAHSTEIKPDCKEPVIDILPE